MGTTPIHIWITTLSILIFQSLSVNILPLRRFSLAFKYYSMQLHPNHTLPNKEMNYPVPSVNHWFSWKLKYRRLNFSAQISLKPAIIMNSHDLKLCNLLCVPCIPKRLYFSWLEIDACLVTLRSSQQKTHNLKKTETDCAFIFKSLRFSTQSVIDRNIGLKFVS